jgi:pilus assembly protein CpaC
MMRRFLLGFLIIASSLSTHAWAQQDAARRIDLGIGGSLVIDLPSDAREIFIGNPAIANAVIRSPRKLYVIGSAEGQTNLFAMDGDGRTFANFEVTVGRDFSTLRRTLKTALPSTQVNVVVVGDSIILTGSVASPLEAQQAVDIAEGFAKRSMNAQGVVVNSLTIRGRDQVMLKVIVAEVQRNVLKQLGVSLDGKWQIGNLALKAASGFALPGAPASIGGMFGGDAVNFTISALERSGVMRTLAEPTLTALSGESANFLAGGEVPVVTSNTCSPSGCQAQYGYKNVGVSLGFKPTVMSEGRISLQVSTEVAEVDKDNGIAVQGTVVTAFKTRRMTTTIELPSGGTLMSAGLMQNRSGNSMAGTPGLMNIPVIGTLFRSRDYQRQETELVIIVTPFIAKPVGMSELQRPDKGYEDTSDPVGFLVGQANRVTRKQTGLPDTTGSIVPAKRRALPGFIVE